MRILINPPPHKFLSQQTHNPKNCKHTTNEGKLIKLQVNFNVTNKGTCDLMMLHRFQQLNSLTS